MAMDIKTSFPSLNNYKIDIDKTFKAEKMKVSSVTQEELLENRRKLDAEQIKSDAAENYWAGLYSSPNSCEIPSNGNYEVSPIVISKDYTFTDPQFITNFVAKESLYEDRIKEKYSGKELEERLNGLNKVSDEAVNKLSEAFAKGIGNFLNGDLNWINDDLTYKGSTENKNNEQNFNVKEFQSHIIDVIKNKKKIFEDVKTQNSAEWGKVINNYGDGLKNFTDKLDNLSNLYSINNCNTIENMSYSDIKAVGTVITTLGGGIYTNSPEVLGAYLGQMKLKGDIMLESCNMSNEVKKTLSNTISQNIARKIVNFSNSHSAIVGTSFNNLEGRVVDSFNFFAKLYNDDLKQFRTEYSKGLNNLMSSLLEGNSYENESPYANKIRFTNSIIDQQVNDWNSFIDKLKIDNDTKKQLNINGFSGNIIDSKF
ncbi:hypothetical protein [Clostridium estertheticum]|uniref:Uncharacterized protein n=1 Tax=Clostridium estertheticum TaxID=238834 RepID=A0AA47EMJ9_9CLOT|nr:hypothetical protein [Clostridium estertheticum]MBU3154031.1 hypothetical protein [Clostridium estertheticum]WAG62952.1 hypothetical protein LL038_12245 [Clostridium estertheticum]